MGVLVVGTNITFHIFDCQSVAARLSVRTVVTHNPFAVNDLWFAQQTGFPLERMNPYGCSLVYGHPQAPTGLRGIVELAHALHAAGGGIGVFTGCAAGDAGAALVLRVD